ncbi:MAG: JAB domain-containing protein [Candidatus Heimdallarchaeota archaeon]
MKNEIKTEEKPDYLTSNNDKIIEQAIAILESRLAKDSFSLNSSTDSSDFIMLNIAELEYEVFGLLHLDNKNRVIETELLFRGTIDGASVYPREVLKSCLVHNCAAVILFHNHPSGDCTPSNADKMITERLKEALGLVDIKVLDHIIAGGAKTFSFADEGLL